MSHDCEEHAGVPDRPDWLAPLDDPRNEEILGAAFAVFAEKGLTGATMAQIAARACVSKETLYDRFDSKEGLFYALLAWGSRVKSARGEDVIELANPMEALIAFMTESLRMQTCAESIALHRVAIGEAGRMPLEVVQVYDEFTCAAGRPAIDRLGERLVEAGLARIEDPDEFAHAAIGLMRGYFFQHVALGLIAPPSEEVVAAFARRAARRLVKAFAA